MINFDRITAEISIQVSQVHTKKVVQSRIKSKHSNLISIEICSSRGSDCDLFENLARSRGDTGEFATVLL
ncbi:hypothetical protein DERP_012166 [Dermatophagoides pteronyssinus]|uniref:Uncharacterized protein n=1 Tax=Dermatophagoides pteronyssinus TaxID=6956 RepID=A0ABQ8J2A9_DERPT|nr:hypothetical protein DERP_012166 [Dermatophagoides pteronyssinus]